uniref:exosome complex component RRP43 n=1 Tax=Myxine glutinosa TaxID=7769 RepID=UPI00358E7884
MWVAGERLRMADAFKAAEPVAYYRRFLKENCRPDGRELGEVRITTLNVGSITSADGSALVKIGNTTVVCGVKGELSAPTTETPGKGYVVPNVDLSPLCSAQFRPGPPCEQAQVAGQFLADVITSSELISLEDLCIQKGKLVWVLYCDLECLDYDGNVLDACSIALLAALRNATLPRVEICPETSLAKVSLTERNPLQVQHLPIATTFAIFDGSVLLTDPTEEEEGLASGVITVVVNEDDRLCSVYKPGGSTASPEQLQGLVGRAQSRARETRRLLVEVQATEALAC